MEILLSKCMRCMQIKQLEILAFNDYIKTTDWKSMNDIFILRREEKNIKVNSKNLEGLGAMNIIENKHWIKKMNKNKIWLFGKTNKIDKSLARLIKKKRAVPSKYYEEWKEDLTDSIKKIINDRMNNFMPVNLKIYMKWANF